VGIDGAHTPDSLNALFRTIAATSKHESVVLVFGAAADKDLDGMLKEAAGAADKVIFTRALANRRSADPAELLRRYEALGGGMAQSFDDVAASLEAARRAAGVNDVILVCGSYSIAGEARTLLSKAARP
jgi:folylpolyglutamate synthase/dihydropteroate synthase